MAKQARLIQTMCDVATVDLSDNITTVFDGPCVVYGVYVNTVLSAQACPIQDGTQAQRTNICLQSEDLSTTWGEATAKTLAIVGNEAIAPNGTRTADLLSDDSSTGNSFIAVQQDLTIATGTTFTYSVYLKADGLDWAFLDVQNLAALAISAYFDLTNGAVGATTGANNTSEFIEGVGNGWFRCGIVFASDAVDSTGRLRIALADSNGDNSVAADGTSSIFVWGVQLEASSSATAYISTTDTARSGNMPPIVLPASFAAGSNRDFPGIRFNEALVVNPDDAATGEITITYRSVNPN